MARVNWHGTEIQATLISTLGDGKYLMRAADDTHLAKGTTIEVRQDQIVGLNVGSAPVPGPIAPAHDDREPVVLTKADVGRLSDLQVTSPNHTMIAPAPATMVVTRDQPVHELAAALDAGTTVTVAPRTAAPSRTSPMATAKTPKLNGLLDAFNKMLETVEAAAGEAHKNFAALSGKAGDTTSNLVAATKPIVGVLQSIDDVANQLSNGGPEGPLPT